MGEREGESPAGAPAVRTSTEGNILVVTLNRPQARNAINSQVSLGVITALERLDSEGALRVGVLAGEGGSFCAGMDLKEFARTGLPKGIDSLLRHGCRKPLVAAIEGVALGGGLELALLADLLVAADGALLGSPEVKFGLFPGGGALVRLPQILPRSIVAQLALTGEPMTARAAYDHGLVVRLSRAGGALEEAMTLARSIAANAPLGVDAVKQLLRLGPGRSERELWAEQVNLVDHVFHSQDAAEGARAFAEKRAPVWKSR